MSERSSYTPGTPCWVELGGVPDLDAVEAFYRDVLGWEIPEQENSAQLGGYRRAKLGGRDVAGVSPRMEEGQPTVWMTYISVEDAAATLAKASEAGGQTIVEPIEVMELGTMAVFSDPTGAVCGIWQPGTFAGSELVNEPGAIAWNELNTRDFAAAKEFYGAVFGWDFHEPEMEGGESYAMIMVGDGPVGGVLDLAARGVPEEIPAHWQVYFGVEDADSAIDTAKRAGGGVMMEPIDIPFGRFAILTDPNGTSFAVIALSDRAQEGA